jgi:acyl-CoA thioesterase-1
MILSPFIPGKCLRFILGGLLLTATLPARLHAETVALVPGGFFMSLKKVWPKNRTIQIVFHGHSVPSGYHKTPEVRTFESYPHLVHRALAGTYSTAVTNCILTGVGGEDSRQGAARFEGEVLSHRPDLIFIDYGLNDRRLTEEQVEEAWTSMIAQARLREIPLVLVTPTGAEDVNFQDSDDKLLRRAELIRKLGRKHGVPVADVFKKWSEMVAAGTLQSTLLSQSNHPNLAGHEVAAGVIVDLLRRSDLGQ